MFRTILNLSCPALLMLAGLLSSSIGKAQEAETGPGQMKYAVYTCLSCSRTLRQVEKFDNLQSAIDKAAELRKTHNFVWVATGDLKLLPFELLPHFRDSRKTQSSVYTKTCSRSGWTLHTTASTATEAESLAESLKGKVRQVEVVYHLAK